jgi:hypothetical protein
LESMQPGKPANFGMDFFGFFSSVGAGVLG